MSPKAHIRVNECVDAISRFEFAVGPPGTHRALIKSVGRKLWGPGPSAVLVASIVNEVGPPQVSVPLIHLASQQVSLKLFGG